MKKGLYALAALLGVATGGLAHAADPGPTLKGVQDRGKVVCGANGGRPGFSGLDSKGQWQGLDVEVCRAVAAATLGKASSTELVKVT